MEKNAVLQLMTDIRNKCVQKYSVEEANDVVRKALVEMNGGSTTFNIKTLRDHPQLYSIIEEYIQTVVHEGLKGNEFFMSYVENRNLKEGDSPEFITPVEHEFIVSEITSGTQALRRQRAGHSSSTFLTPKRQGIRLYDDWVRFMTGRADIGQLSDAMAVAVQKKKMADVYSAWANIGQSALGAIYFPAAGTYDETNLLTQIQHVSAANDNAPVVLGATLLGSRKINTSVVSEMARTEMYTKGYATNFNGVPVQILPQRHKIGSTDFQFSDNRIYLLPVPMDKFIKQVEFGEGFLKIDDVGDNADLSLNLTYLTGWTTALMIGKKFGICDLL